MALALLLLLLPLLLAATRATQQVTNVAHSEDHLRPRQPGTALGAALLLTKTSQEIPAKPQHNVGGGERGLLSLLLSAGAVKPSNRLCGNCLCGRPNRPASRLSGGVPLSPSEMPWLALVYAGEDNVTTGSLINNRYVLTAAAPVQGYTAQDVKVSLGAENVCTGDVSTVNASVSEVLVHPQYDPDSMASDLALLRLTTPVVFSSRISPVCLPPTDRATYLGQVSTAASWSAEEATSANATAVNGTAGNATAAAAAGSACRARKLPLPVLQQRDCFLSNVSARLVTEDKGCAGTPGTAALLCPGDAGGPLLFRTLQGVYQQIGVLASANECGENIYGPSLYTRVAPYLRWIFANTRDACLCSA
ncbi:trypsin-3-like isoform X2 [Schistocerca cancellata]|uniref:trypsin-3-like isoform X2 n=1 Tax=Schistocerca cancellata TaxID=274614 RepID=UPI002118610E|nr:trypsin-3-like isoform X2 [Schistocerca cancellata]